MSEPALTKSLSGQERLRQAVGPLHSAMHRHPVMARLMDSSVSFPDLAAAAGVARDVATALELARHGTGEWPDFSLAPMLETMDQALGPQRPAAPARLWCTRPDRDWLLGGLYVIHGSTLGATVLSAHAVARLGPSAQGYFARGDAALWQCLVATINALPPDHLERAERGAIDLFTAYRDTADACGRVKGRA